MTHLVTDESYISRRALLAAAGVGAAGLLVGRKLLAHTAGGHPGASAPDDFFLSASNPIANADQRDLDGLAISLLSRSDVQAAKKKAAASWSHVTNRLYSPQQWALFDDMLSDYCYSCLQTAVNADPNYPKVMRVIWPGATWMGNKMPSSKWGGDNPDNAYRDIPVEHGGSYVIHGQRQSVPPSYVSYQIMDDSGSAATVGSLEQRDMDIAKDGSFVITLDAAPADGRKNHIQLAPNAAYINIRDSMGDWRQTPDALRVSRVNAPSRGPLTEDEIASHAVRNILSNVFFAYWAIRVNMNVPRRTLIPPYFAGSVGGLVTQVTSSGNFSLSEEEAVVITTNAAGAAYRSIVLYDMWNRSLEYRDHQSHLNAAMMAPDDDGRFTFVVSHRDPGVHNWLDTQGFLEFFIGLRWQGLPAVLSEQPRLDIRVGESAKLATLLPRGVRMTSAQERMKQLRNRQLLYDRRFIDS